MNRERGFWRSLGSVETLEALLVDWQSAMGKEFELGRQFLKPTTQQSEVYPCIKDPPCHCWHEVVECSDGRLMAGCTCEGEDYFGCRAFQVELKDLLIYAMDQRIRHCREVRMITPAALEHINISSIFGMDLFGPPPAVFKLGLFAAKFPVVTRGEFILWTLPKIPILCGDFFPSVHSALAILRTLAGASGMVAK